MIIPHARDAEMHEHIKAWQASGKSQTSYCKQHGIIPHQFIYYKKKLGFMKSTSTNKNELKSSYSNKNLTQIQ